MAAERENLTMMRALMFQAVVVTGCLACTALAEDEGKPLPQAKAPQASQLTMTKCTVGLKAEYLALIGTAAQRLLHIPDGGNEMTGRFNGFEGEFAVIQREGATGGKGLVLIPKSAILYIAGDERPVNF
jgi:hypothetical protein